MKSFSTLALAAALLLLLLTTQPACYYDNEEELYPNATCDTTAITYSGEIKRIFDDNCASCHTGTSGVSGIPMETHALLAAYATNGKLVARTNDVTNPMPQSGLLGECDRLKIKAWVNEGAPDN